MEEKKQYCENLIRRYEELKDKGLKARDMIPGKPITPSFITPLDEMSELNEIRKKLKEECRNLLSMNEKFKIGERLGETFFS